MVTVADREYVPLMEDNEGEFVHIEGTVFRNFTQADSVVQSLGFKPVIHNWEGRSEIVYRNYVTDTLLVLEEYHGK